MSRTILPQTKRKIDALKAIGLKRSSFSVRTPCNSRGEYQDTKVYLYGYDAADKVIENYPELLDTGEFDIVFYVKEGQYINVIIRSGSGRLTICSWSNEAGSDMKFEYLS